jgi:hypothetical protein
MAVTTLDMHEISHSEAQSFALYTFNSEMSERISIHGFPAVNNIRIYSNENISRIMHARFEVLTAVL